MKKIAAALLLTAAPVLVMAQNTITFNGEVTNQTCTVKVDNGNASPTIKLDLVKTSDLASSGSTAGLKVFSIGVDGCIAVTATPTPQSTVKVKFSSNNANSQGRLSNALPAGAGTAATLVDLELLNVGDDKTTLGTVINLSNETSLVTLGTLVGAATALSKNFGVRYHATGAATIGLVQSTLTYGITYQ